MSAHTPIIDLLRCERLVLKQRRRVLKLRERLEENEEILRALIQASVLARAATTLPADDAGDDLPSRSGEVTERKTAPGIEDPERGSAVARSGGPGWQATTSSVPGDPPAASAEQLVPSGTAGVDSGGSGAATSTGIRTVPEVGSTPEPAGSSLRHAHAKPGAGFHRGGSAWGKQAKDETGNRYGKLVVIERAPNDGTKVRWRCGCDCGGQIVAWGILLRKGRVTACRTCMPKGAATCSRCGEVGHNSRSCAAAPAPEPAPREPPPKPTRVVGTNPAGPTRTKRFTCFKCGSMPHRVEGVRCSGCGLERSEERLDVRDFTGGGSAIGRAV